MGIVYEKDCLQNDLQQNDYKKRERIKLLTESFNDRIIF